MAPAMSDLVLSVSDVAKSYGATVAVRSVSFDVHAGEVLALMGENGAGKSTIVKTLSGIVRPDRGTMLLGGKAYSPNGYMAARAAGVSTAFQELSLLPNLTVAQNMMMPSQLRGATGLIAAKRNEARTSSILAQYGLSHIHPRIMLGALSLAEKQRVEIVRAISHAPKLLILDEPTAALAEPEWLFAIIERLAATGMGILYISHRLADVRRLCRRGTVLRNGQSVETVDLAGVPDAEIFRLMVGAANEQVLDERPAQSAGRGGVPALSVHALQGGGVRGISFDVSPGEVVGLAALEGQGQRDLLRMLGGAMPIAGGEVKLGGRVVSLGSPAAALRAGIGFVPEERKSEGVFLELPTGANMSLPMLDRLRRLLMIDRRRETAAVVAEATHVDLAHRYLGMRLGALSGGNQQKALIGRVLLSGAEMLVLFDPTRGVDVGTKSVIYGIIRDFAARGGAVLIYSTELAELVHLVDRCVVIYRGQVAAELDRAGMSEARLVALATGHREAA
jgi:ribose transport system ATP-binding protein